MQPHTVPQAGPVEIVLLPIFLLMCFAMIAGGNPSIVLRPVLEIAGRLLMMAFNVAFFALGALCRIGMFHISNWMDNASAKRKARPRVKATTTRGKDNSITIKLK